MACCCKGDKPSKLASSCLGRCDLPKHRCLIKDEIKPGPVPKYMGWLWDARTAPEHQLRCGWRPGHISCPVLRTMEMHHSCGRGCCMPRSCRNSCGSCSGPSPKPKPCWKSKPCWKPKLCWKPECFPPTCATPCLPGPVAVPVPSCTKPSMSCFPPQSVITIIRHGGMYSISTKPSRISNSPSGSHPLKYVLNVDPQDNAGGKAKYSVEAKFNDYHFDYTTSQTSFILDFSPPEQKCIKPCPKKIITGLDPCSRPC